MGEPQFDDEAILEVAREIRSSEIRAKYLRQVCADDTRRTMLGRRIASRRVWQFGLRSLFVVMACVAVLSAIVGFAAVQTARARRLAEMERARAMEALHQSEAARLQLESARLAPPTSSPAP